MTRIAARRQPQAAAPEIGDFIVREAYDGYCGAVVARKTGPRYDDYDRLVGCRTDHAAKRLAKLMNDARDLARDWQQIQDRSPFKDGDAEAWVRHIIVDNVARAIDGTRPEPLGWLKKNEPAPAEDDQ